MARRDWCFTSFDREMIQKVVDRTMTLPNGVTYLCCQVELCPDTGREHVQGFALTKPMRLVALKKAFNDGTMHVEPRRAPTRELARDYCKKIESRVDADAEPLELGEFITQVCFNSALDIYLWSFLTL